MHVTAVEWVVTIAVIIGLFVFDFFAHVRNPHEPTFRESAFWYAVRKSTRRATVSSKL